MLQKVAFFHLKLSSVGIRIFSFLSVLDIDSLNIYFQIIRPCKLQRPIYE